MTAIIQAEILTKLSVVTGAAGNAGAGTPGGSLGKYISTTAWAGTTLNDLFDDVSGAENAASVVEYRCIFVQNTNGANAYNNAVVYLSSEVAGGAGITIAIDNIAASAIGAAGAQADIVANVNTAPTGVGAFSAPTTFGTALALGSIPVGYCKAIWIKRAAANTVAINNDGGVLTITGDTGAL